MALSLIVAVNNLGYIGKGGRLPWRDEEDMQNFLRLTQRKVCIAGRKTYRSLPQSFFEGREVVMATRTKYDDKRNYDFDYLIKKYPDAFIIGGAEIYDLAIKSGKVKYFYITHVDDMTVGDALYPAAVPWYNRGFEDINKKHVDN